MVDEATRTHVEEAFALRLRRFSDPISANAPEAKPPSPLPLYLVSTYLSTHSCRRWRRHFLGVHVAPALWMPKRTNFRTIRSLKEYMAAEHGTRASILKTEEDCSKA